MSTHDSPTTRRFVRTAWILLIFQLFAAAGAVGAAVWAWGAVRTLVSDRDMLQARVAELEAAQNQAVPAAPVEPPAAPPGNQVIPEPAVPIPPTVTPPPVPAPTPPVRPGRPARPPQSNPPPVATPPVEQPPVYTPPPYTPPPPPANDKPVYEPPPERPQRPERPRPQINVPGLIWNIINNRPRPQRPQRPPTTNPTRPPASSDTPSTRPPASSVPGTTQPPRTANANPILRRMPRRTPTTTAPQDPVVR